MLTHTLLQDTLGDSLLAERGTAELPSVSGSAELTTQGTAISHTVPGPRSTGIFQAQSKQCLHSLTQPLCLGHELEAAGAGARGRDKAAFPGVPEQPDAMQTLISRLQRNSMDPSVTFFALNQVGEGAKVHVANVGMHSTGT